MLDARPNTIEQDLSVLLARVDHTEHVAADVEIQVLHRDGDANAECRRGFSMDDQLVRLRPQISDGHSAIAKVVVISIDAFATVGDQILEAGEENVLTAASIGVRIRIVPTSVGTQADG